MILFFKKSSLQIFGNKMRRVKQKMSGENDFGSCVIKRFNLREKTTNQQTTTKKQKPKNKQTSPYGVI